MDIKGTLWFLYYALPTSVYSHSWFKKRGKRNDEERIELVQGWWLSREEGENGGEKVLQ